MWRYSFHSETFSLTKDPKVKSLTLKSNLPEGTFGRLHSLDRFSGEGMSLDPKFVILMTSCLKDHCASDRRQECLFDKQALSLKPSLKSVRVLTLPHMEFEFCNVYRGTCGKTLPS